GLDDRVHHVLAHLCRSHRSGHPVAHIETAAAADMRPRPGARTGNGATEAPPSKITRVWACGANHHSVTWLSFPPALGGSPPGMTAPTPTIVATSGGYRPGRRTPLELDALVRHAVDRAGVSGRTPRLGYLGTANGDQQFRIAMMAEAARLSGYELRPLTLFTMPNVEDVAAYLLEADVLWVGGGSVANLLAVWGRHSRDEIFRRGCRAVG